MTAIKQFTSRFGAKETKWFVYDNNIFELNLEGATEDTVALYDQGRVHKLDCYRRGDHVWPLNMVYKCIFRALKREKEITYLAERFIFELEREKIPVSVEMARICLEALEGLVTEGWVTASYDPKLPLLDVGRGEDEPQKD